MENPTRNRRAGTLAAAGVLALVACAPAAAQEPGAAAPRWEAWGGCWQPTGDPSAPVDTAAAAAAVTCVIPGGDGAVEVVTVSGDEVMHRERIRGDQRREVEREGCTGWESAEPSADGRRVYRHSELTCAGGLLRRSGGVMALDADEWLDVTGVSAGGNTEVQVVRYRPVAVPSALDQGERAALEDNRLALDAARIAAVAPLSVDDVVEATRRLEPEVVEAWLLERGQGFNVDAGTLVALERAGVPERVIDLMVALSYPDVFAINYRDREAERRPGAPPRRAPRPRPVYGWAYPGYGWYPGYGHGGYWGRPVVIVQKDPNRGGRAVKGRGYTRGRSGGSTPTTTSAPRPSGSKGDAPAPSGTRRTAKPRSGGG